MRERERERKERRLQKQREGWGQIELKKMQREQGFGEKVESQERKINGLERKEEEVKRDGQRDVELEMIRR